MSLWTCLGMLAALMMLFLLLRSRALFHLISAIAALAVAGAILVFLRLLGNN